MDKHKRLYDLLGELGARPDGLHWDDIEGWTRGEDGNRYEDGVSPDHALAILRDAARRVCDDCPDFDLSKYAPGIEGWGQYYAIAWYYDEDMEPLDESEYENEIYDTYELALIAGLEWETYLKSDLQFDQAQAHLDDKFGGAMKRLAESEREGGDA